MIKNTLRSFSQFFWRLLLAAALSASLLPAAYAAKVETGWLSDEKGSFDPKTRATVILVSNMNGSQQPGGSMVWKSRYVGLEMPVQHIDPKKISLIGEDGKPLPHKYPEAFDAPIGKNDEKGSIVKLFIDRPAGFKFKLRIDP